VARDGDRVRPLTSNRHDWTKRFPWIVESALKNRHKQFAIDEAVILGVDGIADFNALHSRARRRRMTLYAAATTVMARALPQCNLVARQNESPLSN